MCKLNLMVSIMCWIDICLADVLIHDKNKQNANLFVEMLRFFLHWITKYDCVC
jgi:hypothetical protein